MLYCTHYCTHCTDGVVYGVVHGYCYPLLGTWYHANDLHLIPHKTSLLRSTHLVGSKANVQEEDVTYPMYKRTTCGGYTIPTSLASCVL